MFGFIPELEAWLVPPFVAGPFFIQLSWQLGSAH